MRLARVKNRARISVPTVLTVLLLASLWGLLEVSLGSWMRAVSVEWCSALLCGLGLGLAGIALGHFLAAPYGTGKVSGYHSLTVLFHYCWQWSGLSVQWPPYTCEILN